MQRSLSGLITQALKIQQTARALYQAGMITLGDAYDMTQAAERLLRLASHNEVWGLSGEEEALALKELNQKREEGADIL